MSPGMTVAPPLCMEKTVVFADGLLGHLTVVGEMAAVPSRPDTRAIDIDDVAAEVAPSDGGQSGAVEVMGKRIEFGHERAYGVFLEFDKVAWPVVFIAQSP